MASTVTVTVSGPRADEIPLSTEALMHEVGLLARERVIRRTLSGLDEQELPFYPYSVTYRLRKMAEVGTAEPVNLQLSGDMLNAITIIEIARNTVALGFSR